MALERASFGIFGVFFLIGFSVLFPSTGGPTGYRYTAASEGPVSYCRRNKCPRTHGLSRPLEYGPESRRLSLSTSTRIRIPRRDRPDPNGFSVTLNTSGKRFTIVFNVVRYDGNNSMKLNRAKRRAELISRNNITNGNFDCSCVLISCGIRQILRLRLRTANVRAQIRLVLHCSLGPKTIDCSK